MKKAKNQPAARHIEYEKIGESVPRLELIGAPKSLVAGAKSSGSAYLHGTCHMTQADRHIERQW
jgi:hypothetical protein